MPTEHCPVCEPDSPCGGGHVYVIELGHGIQEKSRYKNRVHLYVGETQNTVERRMQSNLTRSDKKTVVSKEEARFDNTNDWHFASVKVIRKHYLKHRPDLYSHLNPIEKNRKDLKIAERRLARHLEREKEDGVRKFHVHGDGKKKRKKKKKS
jgi:hypothetical protein